MDLGLRDRVYVVTGASRGLGRAAVQRLASVEGHHVIATARDPAQLEPMHSRLAMLGCRIDCHPLDVTDDASVAALRDWLAERFGRIHVLINNAGGSFSHNLEDLSPNGFDAVVRNNLHQVFYCCSAVRPIMAEQGGGRIINISSVAGLRGTPGLGAYGAAKAGVINLTETLALEWASYNIAVNCIAPGIILTEGMEEVLASSEEAKRELERRIPLRRLGVPEDILNACLYLATEASSYVTGETIKVAGGGTGRF